MKTRRILPLVLMLSVFGASAAFAGGPLLIFDEATQTPFAYGAPVVDFWTDTSANGPLTNAQMDVLTANGVAAWTAVPTSSFTGNVAGDNSAYPHAPAPPLDVTGANAGSVIGLYNGGDNDIHVIYDSDGSVVSGFFGAPPGVLGIASPDFSDGSANLIEGWAVLNGATIDPGDVAPFLGASWNGVVTHEFGHSINLAHSQTNGANGFFGDSTGPDGCNPLPWAGGVTFNDFETMYPFIDPSPGSVGIQMADINVLDDINSISNIYPGAGWPGNFGSISGTIYLPDGVTELTGANVVARNVADPYEDAVSALSGDYTQGNLGPDGRFNFNGLTPGACYVVFVNGIVNGGFSTTPATVTPEEFYNGANENGQVGSDDPCESTQICVAAGQTVGGTDIILNGDPNDLGLGDDDFVEVQLPWPFPFCGQVYNSVFVNSNGNITFGAGDTDFSETVAEFLAESPRIAPNWDDYSPNQGGSVTALAVGVDFVISWNAVPQFLAGDINTFSVTLRSDGTYQCDYPSMQSTDGLAGRTEGGGAVDPGETDLTAAIQPIGSGLGTVYESFTSADNDLDGETHEWAPCGGPVPVKLAAISLVRDGVSAKLAWEVSEATNHLGFNVYREDAGERTKLSTDLLSGNTAYEFVDPAAPAGRVNYWLSEINREGRATWHGPFTLSPLGATPAILSLAPARPNPFAAQTQIRFNLPAAGDVTISIFDAQGRRVRTLMDRVAGAGEHTVLWDGANNNGQQAAAGFYVVRLETGSERLTQKVVLTP